MKLLNLLLIGILATAIGVRAQNLLIWDNDNFSVFPIPEASFPVGCEYGIQKALLDNNYSFTTIDVLPADISSYDVIFITLGFPVDCG